MTASEASSIFSPPAAAITVMLGAAPLTLEALVAIARDGAQIHLNPDPAWRERIQAGARLVDELLTRDGLIYGVTTGYGDSCTVTVPPEQAAELARQIFRFHGCGMGAMLDPVAGRAVLVARLASLARGYSGVSLELLERMVWLLNHDIIPVIPEEGSVGASGDLTPLSYVAAVLCGERNVYVHGEIRDVASVYKAHGITPLTLRAKEGLALMNGTAVMTALACLAYERTSRLSRLSARLTAMAVIALKANAYHFDEGLFALKPHPGQNHIASRIRADLQAKAAPAHADRLQDRYSLRCAPHIIGVLEDSLPWLRQFIEIELNSSNDNPLIDPDSRRVLHGGHFYGGHIAQAMDATKTMVANLADLLDRQLAQLVDVKYSNGLPRNLSGASGERSALNHGFKAVQIAVSAWTAEALKLTLPASIFSRSTECHNQDKVSMGTIAARDALRVLTLTEQCAAALLLANTQALWLRERHAEIHLSALAASVQNTMAAVAANFEFIEEDRPLDADLRYLQSAIATGRLDKVLL